MKEKIKKEKNFKNYIRGLDKKGIWKLFHDIDRWAIPFLVTIDGLMFISPLFLVLISIAAKLTPINTINLALIFYGIYFSIWIIYTCFEILLRQYLKRNNKLYAKKSVAKKIQEAREKPYEPIFDHKKIKIEGDKWNV